MQSLPPITTSLEPAPALQIQRCGGASGKGGQVVLRVLRGTTERARDFGDEDLVEQRGESDAGGAEQRVHWGNSLLGSKTMELTAQASGRPMV